MIDKLIEKIKQYENPSVAGIDTAIEYLPDSMTSSLKTLQDCGRAITDFNVKLIDALKDVVPAIKVQIAYYESYGLSGLEAFKATVEYGRENGLIVIGDIKRNDIGDTAKRYSDAYIGKTKFNQKEESAYFNDFITVNGYLGFDGIKPFLKDCEEFDKGLFILVKTSNPSSGEFQDLVFNDGNTLYEKMGLAVKSWGEPYIGKYGYSDIGAVVGATHKAQAERLRELMPSTFFLVPGYGAQGGKADDLTCCFDDRCLGAIVNSSRGIICAYKNEKYSKLRFDKAAREAALFMRDDIVSALNKCGKKF